MFGFCYSFSWNFNFHGKVSDFEIEDLERIISSLTHFHLSPSTPHARVWSLSSLGLFTVKSFFVALSNHSDPVPFIPSNFV